jgi:hypothetical protein
MSDRMPGFSRDKKGQPLCFLVQYWYVGETAAFQHTMCIIILTAKARRKVNGRELLLRSIYLRLELIQGHLNKSSFVNLRVYI